MIGILALIQPQSDRYTLNYLHVIAGRVFGRQQTEYRTRASGDALDMARISAPIRVDIDLNRVTGSHVPELRLFEIRGYPDVIQWHDGHQLLSRRDVLPGLRGSLGDNAIHWRND